MESTLVEGGSEWYRPCGESTLELMHTLKQQHMGAAIAPWFRICLSSCGPRFESQAHHLRFFQFVLLKLLLELEKNKNKQKEAGIGPYLKHK